MNNRHTTLLLILLASMGTPRAHAMAAIDSPNTSARKMKIHNTQLLWQLLDSNQESIAKPILACPLPHIDFVAAILTKLEEQHYPILPPQKDMGLTTRNLHLQMLSQYCAATNNKRVLLQQEMNNIAEDDNVEFRLACLKYFQILYKKPAPSPATLQED